MNLLEETIEWLKQYSKIPSQDILWIGSSDFWFTWQDFEEIARYADYDSGFGAQEVAQDLVIVGDDWFTDRDEYDGSECWSRMLHCPPDKPKKYRKPTALTVRQATDVSCGWETLSDLNKDNSNKQKES